MNKYWQLLGTILDLLKVTNALSSQNNPMQYRHYYSHFIDKEIETESDANKLTQGHTASKRQSQNSSPGSLALIYL